MSDSRLANPEVDVSAYKIPNLIIGLIEDSGYTVEVARGVDRWARFMADEAPGRLGLNPTLDPSISDLTPDNAFTLWVHRGDLPVSCMVSRVIRTDDLVGMFRTGRIWGDRALYRDPATLGDLPAVTPSEPIPHIAGMVGYQGGMWARPGEPQDPSSGRKKGFPWLLSRLGRAVSRIRFDPDWHCGNAQVSLVKAGIPRHGYGYPHVDLLHEGFWPVTGNHDTVYLNWMNRLELLAQQRIDAEALERRRPGEPMDLFVRRMEAAWETHARRIADLVARRTLTSQEAKIA